MRIRKFPDPDQARRIMFFSTVVYSSVRTVSNPGGNIDVARK